MSLPHAFMHDGRACEIRCDAAGHWHVSSGDVDAAAPVLVQAMEQVFGPLAEDGALVRIVLAMLFLGS